MATCGSSPQPLFSGQSWRLETEAVSSALGQEEGVVKATELSLHGQCTSVPLHSHPSLGTSTPFPPQPFIQPTSSPSSGPEHMATPSSSTSASDFSVLEGVSRQGLII